MALCHHEYFQAWGRGLGADSVENGTFPCFLFQNPSTYVHQVEKCFGHAKNQRMDVGTQERCLLNTAALEFLLYPFAIDKEGRFLWLTAACIH